MRPLTRLLIFLLLLLSAVGLLLIAGMRTKSPPVLRAVRKVNRRVLNPRQMRSAGTEGAFASVVHHVGRTTGTSYETPVGAVPTPDGFVIALPYGSESDWLKNVLAAGGATLVSGGEAHTVGEPEIVVADAVAHHFSRADQRAHRLFGVDEALRVRRIDP